MLYQLLDGRPREVRGVASVIEREHASARRLERRKRFDTTEFYGASSDAFRDERDEATASNCFEHEKGVVELAHRLRAQSLLAQKVFDLPMVRRCRPILEDRQVLPVVTRFEVRMRNRHEHGAMDHSELDVGTGRFERLRFADQEIDL